MTNWLRTLLIGGAAAAAVAVGAYFAAPYVRQMLGGTPSAPTHTFTKAAYDASGNPVVGPVHPGDTIQYVLSYPTPATGTSGPTTIVDTLSSNQSYVAGSLQAPGWTWTPSAPYSTSANQTTYTNPGILASGFTLNVPAPSVGAPASVPGDGYKPIPVGQRVFSIFHHASTSPAEKIMCWNAIDFSSCGGGYPKPLDPSGISAMRATSSFDQAAVVGTKIYYASARFRDSSNNIVAEGSGASTEFVLGCWDTSSDAACPAIQLPSTPTAAGAIDGLTVGAYIAGAVKDPTRPNNVLMYALGSVYCIDVSSGNACASWPASVGSPLLGDSISNSPIRDMIVEEGSSAAKVFVSYWGSTGERIGCVLLSNGAGCAGWPVSGPTSGTEYGLSPYLTGTVMTGVCLHQSADSAPQCFQSSTGAPLGSPPVTGTTGSNHTSLGAYHIPGTSRVLHAQYIFNPTYCYDFASSAACSGFAPSWSNAAYKDYGFASDPVKPDKCLLGLGHAETLWRFDAATGQQNAAVCFEHPYDATFHVDMDQYCFNKPQHVTWTNVEIVGRPPELQGGTIVIKDGGGNVLQTIPVSSQNSYTLNIPAVNATDAVTVEFTPSYGSNPPPTSAYQIKLDYIADVNPQICYKTTIKDCTDGVAQADVTNKAVYTDPAGTREAEVNLGKPLGGKCGPQPCLVLHSSIAANGDGTGTVTLTGSGPPGFTAKDVTVISLTPGVTVQPPASHHFPSGNINGTWNLTGLTPGQTITLEATATQPGAGDKGSDKCCTSIIILTVPQEHQHTDIAINKTAIAEGQGPANGSGYIYTLAVTNMSDPLNGQNVIVVTDVVPAGLSFASASGTDWNCTGPFPIAAGGTLTCTYTGSGLLATGQALPPITVTSTNAVPGAQLPAITNCAHVALSPASGRTDYDPTNDQSCVTDGTGSGSLTIIKVVNPVQGHDNSSAVFNVDGICTPPGGSASTTTFSFGGSNGYQHTIPNLASGTTCSIAEQTPPPPAADPKNCHWDTTYPDAQMATIGSGEVTLRVVNTENCIRGVKAGGSGGVKVTKHVDSNGVDYSMLTFRVKVACGPGTTSILRLNRSDAFQQTISNLSDGTVCSIGELPPQLPPGVNRGCHWSTTYPGGTKTTIEAGVTNNMRVSNFLECQGTQSKCEPQGHWNGRKCVVCNDGHVWDERKNACTTTLVCETQSTRPSNGTCLCRYRNMLRHDETSCACPMGSVLVPGLGCEVHQHAACDEASTRADGGKCLCRYDGMTQDTPNHCMCPQGTALQEGHGCMASCPDNMVLNSHGTCGCPKGAQLKDGKCVKKHSFLDNILDNVHVGVGVGGGSSGPGKTKTKTHDPKPQQDGVDGR